jgi:hypothetical protein
MRSRRVLVLFAACASLLPLAAKRSAAQRAEPAVLVLQVNDSSGHPIPRAHVVVGGMLAGTLTDARGVARLGGILPGNRLIQVNRSGYAFTRVAADFLSGDTVRRTLQMVSAPIELEGITATSWGRSTALRRRGFYDRQRRGFGSFMTTERIEELRPQRTLELMRYMRGVMITKDRRGHDMLISTRGMALGQCLPRVWVDGMQMFMSSADDQVAALDMVPPDDIEGIEVFAGPATIPAEYNPTGTACGVVLLWTRQ